MRTLFAWTSAATLTAAAASFGLPSSAVATTPTGTPLVTATTSAVSAATTPTPPMGWNSYNAYACDNGAQNMLAVAKFIHDSGLQKDGYAYVNTDGCYDDLESLDSPNTYGVTAPTKQDPETCGAINGRLPDGQLYVNSYLFPPSRTCANDGLKLVGDQLHAMGLKLGVYLDASNNWNCEEIPGSYGFDATDAKTLASWGADFVKLDWGCKDTTVPPASNGPDGYSGIDAAPGNQGFGGPTFSTNPAYDTDQQTTQTKMYDAMVAAIDEQQRPIAVSIAGAGTLNSQIWGLPMADMDRPTGDSNANFTAIGRRAAGSVVGIINSDAQTYDALTGPGHWIDPDAMEVGNGSLTATQDRSEMSMFSEMSLPLLMSTNLCPSDCGPDTTPATKDQLSLAVSVFGNKRVIAVDQDPLGSPAHIVGTFDGTHLVMAKPLANGDLAVTLFNESTTDAASMSASAADLGLPAGSYRVQDLWTGATTSSDGSVTATVAPSQTVMYRISPTGKHVVASTSAADAAAEMATTVAQSALPAMRVRQPAGSDTPANLLAVSCSSASECVGVDNFGSAVAYDPADTTRRQALAVAPGVTLASVSCPTGGSTCTALGRNGTAYTLSVRQDRLGLLGSEAVDPMGEPTGIDCTSARSCVAVDGKGTEISFDPTTGRTSRHQVDPFTYLAAVSCVGSSQCTAVGGGGNGGDTVVTFDPQTGTVGAAGVTSVDPVTGNGDTAVSCPSANQCTTVDGSGNEVSFDPATGQVNSVGVVALEGASVPAGLGVMNGVSCTGTDACTAVDASGKAVLFDPSTGSVQTPVDQTALDPDGDGFEAVSCSAAACVAVDLDGRSVTFEPDSISGATTTLIDPPVRSNR